MATKKNQNVDYGLGEILLPVFDLFNILILKVIELLSDGVEYVLNEYILKNNKEDNAPKIERKHLEVKKSTLADEAIGYSVTRKRNILNTELNKSDHTAIVGASGSGKTVAINTLIYADLLEDKPVIYIDPKGDNETLLTFINMCLLTGRDFAIFSEYYNGKGSCNLNPVLDGSIINITDRIFNSFTWSEEHYAQICYDALEESIRFLKEEDSSISIENIYHKLLFISDPSKKAESLFHRDEIKGILSRLRKFINSDYGPKLKGESSLSFSEIRKSKKCLYIGLSVLGYPQMARSLGRMIMGDIAYCAYDAYKKMTPKNKRELSKLGLYIDELSAIITPDEFIELLNKIRGAKMELTFGFQSPSDIKKVDQELLTQVLENTSNWLIGKQRMREGAQLFSDSIGTNESTKQTVRVEDGEELDQGSQRIVEELTAHSNIIKNLGKGQFILLRHYPTRLDLLNLKYIDPEIVWDNVKYLKKENVLFKTENEKKLTTTNKEKNIRKGRIFNSRDEL